MARRNWNTAAPRLTGVSSCSRFLQRTTNWKTSMSGRAIPARARRIEIATTDHASRSTNGTRSREAGPSPSYQAASAMQIEAGSATRETAPVREKHCGHRQLHLCPPPRLQLGDREVPDVRRDDVREARRRLDDPEDADELPACPGSKAAERGHGQDQADEVHEREQEDENEPSEGPVRSLPFGVAWLRQPDSPDRSFSGHYPFRGQTRPRLYCGRATGGSAQRLYSRLRRRSTSASVGSSSAKDPYSTSPARS